MSARPKQATASGSSSSAATCAPAFPAARRRRRRTARPATRRRPSAARPLARAAAGPPQRRAARAGTPARGRDATPAASGDASSTTTTSAGAGSCASTQSSVSARYGAKPCTGTITPTTGRQRNATFVALGGRARPSVEVPTGWRHRHERNRWPGGWRGRCCCPRSRGRRRRSACCSPSRSRSGQRAKVSNPLSPQQQSDLAVNAALRRPRGHATPADIRRAQRPLSERRRLLAAHPYYSLYTIAKQRFGVSLFLSPPRTIRRRGSGRRRSAWRPTPAGCATAPRQRATSCAPRATRTARPAIRRSATTSTSSWRSPRS